MTDKPTRDELQTQLREAQTKRGGVKRFSVKSPVNEESVEFFDDIAIERTMNTLKRELRELEGPAPRIFNVKASRGYGS